MMFILEFLREPKTQKWHSLFDTTNMGFFYLALKSNSCKALLFSNSYQSISMISQNQENSIIKNFCVFHPFQSIRHGNIIKLQIARSCMSQSTEKIECKMKLVGILHFKLFPWFKPSRKQRLAIETFEPNFLIEELIKWSKNFSYDKNRKKLYRK